MGHIMNLILCFLMVSATMGYMVECMIKETEKSDLSTPKRHQDWTPDVLLDTLVLAWNWVY